MNRRFILIFILFFFIQSSWCLSGEKSISDKKLVLGLDLGLAEAYTIRDVNFALGYSTFNYLPDKKTLSSARYGVSLSRAFKLNSLEKIIIGLGYHRSDSLPIKGTLQQGISTPLYTANYQYTIQLSQLLAEVKAQYTWRRIFYPYMTAGIGGGLNTARKFTTTVPGYLTVTPAFADHTRSSVSYMLGLGMDTLLASNVTAGIGYVFSDFGQVGTGNGLIRGRTLSNNLNSSHLYMNTLLAQLNWYF